METKATNIETNWFKTWFDTSLYHLLYQDRNTSEAEAFIHNLLGFLQPKPGATILDLACGRGRHSRFLASKGFDVTGIDLSPANIKFAEQFESDQLSFFRHDMRKPFRINYFDYIFNFFTSFGYFIDRKDNLKTIKSVYSELKHSGIFVLDYLNPSYVRTNYTPREEKLIDGVKFRIYRRLKGDRIIKEIDIEKEGKQFYFMENVALMDFHDFEGLFEEAGLKIKAVFGDYEMNPFEPNSSSRCILVAEKI